MVVQILADLFDLNDEHTFMRRFIVSNQRNPQGFQPEFSILIFQFSIQSIKKYMPEQIPRYTSLDIGFHRVGLTRFFPAMIARWGQTSTHRWHPTHFLPFM